MKRSLIGLSLLCVFTEPIAANGKEIDGRITERSALPVGLVRGMLGALGPFGSAFLIDDCRALTAKHVIGRGRVLGKRVSFRLRPWEAKDGSNFSIATVIRAGPGPAGADFSGDWALLRLDHCLGARNGYLPITAESFWLRGLERRFEPRLSSVGFPTDRSRRGLTIDPDCEARERTTHGLRHDCLTRSGNSGGPLIAWNSTLKRFEAVGIAVARYEGDGLEKIGRDRASLAVELLLIRERLSLSAGGQWSVNASR